MIKFIDKEGIIYDGSSPYVHWVDGQQSTNIIYSKKLMVLADTETITVKLPENDIFKLIDIKKYGRPKNPLDSSENPEVDNNTLTLDYLIHNYFEWDDQLQEWSEKRAVWNDEKQEYDYIWITKENANENTKVERINNLIYDGEQYNDYYVYQILLVASSESPCQITEHLTIEAGNEVCDTIIGGDFYDLNEVLSINLENRGLELPVTIQKAIYESDIHNNITDNILINRKFKELISNYLDIVDNKGSYLSLYNSLQWFEWGDYAKLYEIWETDKDRFLEKDMEFTLSDIYQSLLSSARKTTHISLTAALNQNIEESDIVDYDSLSHDEKIKALLDDDKNPKIKDIPYQWAKDDLYLKIVILGAFFERYFMPIHLDLKRVAMEALVYTPWINMANGTLYRTSNFLYDTGIVNIDMDHVVTLGNLEGYSVGIYTMFGIKDMEKYFGEKSVFPIGVDPIHKVQSTMPAQLDGLIWDPIEEELVESKIEWNVDKPNPEDNIGWEGSNVNYGEHDDIMITFPQTGGNVGVIVPIKAYFNLPSDDIIHRAELYVYRGADKEHMPSEPQQHIIEKGLWKPINEVVTFNFNLLSLKEEIVSFVLVFYSVSGHIWTACASYESIDVSGSYLKIYRIENTDNSYNSKNIVFDSITNKDQDGNIISNKYWLKGAPYGIQYNTIELNKEPDGVSDDINSIYGDLVQYIPTKNYEQLNQLFLIENQNIYPERYIYNYIELEEPPVGVEIETVSVIPEATEDSPDYIRIEVIGGDDDWTYYKKVSTKDETVLYDSDWVYKYKNIETNLSILNHFWVFPRGELDSYGNNRYYVLIERKPGKVYQNMMDFVAYIADNYKYMGDPCEINVDNIKRSDYIFIPQLHLYNDIERLPLKKDEITKKYVMTNNDYLITRGTLLSIIPQFRRSIIMDKSSIKWEFTNMSRPDLDPIIYQQPVSEIMIADNIYKDLTPGYWTVTMYYKMVGSGEIHKLTKDSAFKIEH